MNSAPADRASTGQCRGLRAVKPRDSRAIFIRLHLAGHHVEVADHEAHDLHEQVRQPQPLEAEQQLLRLGGRGEGEAGQHAEGALDQQRPRPRAARARSR